MQTHKKPAQIGLRNRQDVQPVIDHRRNNAPVRDKASNAVGANQYRFAQMPLYATTPGEPLRINQPHDRHEQEAEKTASGKQLPDQGVHQTASDWSHRPQVSPGIQHAIASTQHKGNTLDEPTLEHMQQRTGYDFSHIHIHSNEESATLAESLQANAFTVGQDIYFNQGRFAPQSEEGQQLLAHELTHSLQQQNGQQAVQREEKKTGEPEKPEIDFHVLPPDLKLKFHHLVFAADTDKVQLDYSLQGLRMSLGYKYGSALSLGLRSGDTSASLGWTPGSNQLGLGLSRPGMSGSLGYDPDKQKLSLGLHYGDKLLPSPDIMGQKFQAGGMAVGSMLGGLPGVVNDPFQFYKDHKADIGSISDSVDMVKQVTDYGKKKIRFGADLNLTWDPVSKLVIGGKVGVMF